MKLAPSIEAKVLYVAAAAMLEADFSSQAQRVWFIVPCARILCYKILCRTGGDECNADHGAATDGAAQIRDKLS